MGSVVKICLKAALTPIYESSKYYDRFVKLLPTQKVEDWVAPIMLAQYREAVDAENQGLPPKAPLEIERQIVAKLNYAYHAEYVRTQQQAQDRWHFESKIRRPYFHVTKLEKAELKNWHQYLDYEQKQGDFERTSFLYERCLVACALYDKFWLRYARWMFSQGKEENARIIYMRASTVFVPVERPNVRLKWARFEEKLGRFAVARDIHLAMMEHVPDDSKIVLSLANLIRRHNGIGLAVQFLEDQIERNTSIAGRLVAEQARMLGVCKNKPEEARQVFEDKKKMLASNTDFWMAWLKFEIDQPATYKVEEQITDVQEIHTRVTAVFDQIPMNDFTFRKYKALVKRYQIFLLECGGSDIAPEYVTLDMWANGFVQTTVE